MTGESSPRRSWRGRGPVLVLALAMVLGPAGTTPISFGGFDGTTVLAQETAVPEGPEGMAFYDPPTPLPDGEHGDVIWAREIEAIPGARAWRVLYLSTTLSEEPVAVSSLVIAPEGDAPAEGRPIVSWAHGTTGIARVCAPSLVDEPAQDISIYYFPNANAPHDYGVPSLTQFIEAGYVVASTDYQGLGTPGIHQYVIGQTQGRNVLDAARAAQQIPEAGAGKQLAVLGWSQGGGAAVWAGQLADYTSSHLDLLGVAALAPADPESAGDAMQQFTAAGNQLQSTSLAQQMMLSYAMTHVFPDLSLSDVFTPYGVEFMTEAALNQCVYHMADAGVYQQQWNGPLLLTEPTNTDAWQQRVDEVSAGNAASLVPVAVFQGEADITVFPQGTADYVADACKFGAPVSYTTYPDIDHQHLVAQSQGDYLQWIADRFAGKPAPSTCT